MNSDLPAITCFEVNQKAFDDVKESPIALDGVKESPIAFDGVKESPIAFDGVEESPFAFDFVEESRIAIECVTESQISVEGPSESQVAFHCDEKSHRSVECVKKCQIKDVDCVVGKMMSTLKSKRFSRKKRVVNYKRKHILLEHSYTIKDTPQTMRRKFNVCLDKCRAMKSKFHVYQQRAWRLRKKIKTFHDLILELRSKNLLSDQSAEAIEASFSQEAASIIQRQLGRSQKKLSCNKYPEELRKFALTLQFYSGKAYSYVRKIFSNALPHPQTLSKWYNCVDGEPGFSEQVFSSLRNMTAQKGMMLCSLMMDEVAIRKQIDYDGKRYVGYVDMGLPIDDQAGLHVAREALVFMIVSMTEYWKVPIGYFLIDGLGSHERANLVTIGVTKLHECGVKVISLTFDGCSANCMMVSELGGCLMPQNQICSFAHPCEPAEKIFIILDPCTHVKIS